MSERTAKAVGQLIGSFLTAAILLAVYRTWGYEVAVLYAAWWIGNSAAMIAMKADR